MNAIERPTSVCQNKDKTVTLYFENQPPAIMYLRGGICWPILVGIGLNKKVQGFAVLVGYNPEDKTYWVLEEAKFLSIEHIRGEDQLISYKGLTSFLATAWHDYLADRFFYHQPHETHRKYYLETIRSETVQPKPHMQEVDWDEDDIADQAVYEKVQLGRLKTKKDGDLAKAVDALRVDPDHASPEWNALRCCLVGFDRFPYRKRKEL